MLKILFVCHGNICRSPMAEYIMRDLLQKRGITGVMTASAATSTEELGNPVHRGTREVLNRLGIDCSDKRARQIKKSDYEEYDLLLGMDTENLRNMLRFWGDPEHKIYKLLDYAEIGAPRRGKDVADPWYTGDFEQTYSDIKAGCEGIIATIERGGFGWDEYDSGKTIGTVGSEGGTIIRDEEYRHSARITLEKMKDGCAVTVGVYGAFVHTAWFDGSEADGKYGQMKNELTDFFNTETTEDEEYEFYSRFADKY